MKLALWQYPIEQLASFAAWRAKLAAGIGEAARAGADLCVLPEYAAMELTSLAPGETALAGQVAAMQRLLPGYLEAHAALAREHGVTIVGGSFPERVAGEGVINRARIHTPDRGAIVVEKLVMTRFEREEWGVAGGDPDAQVVAEIPLRDGGGGTAKIGVALCYDSEFPLVVRRLAAAGAELVCVPSCTDAATGYHRVEVACRARALENQCYVAQVTTVGDAPWSIAVDTNVGAAAVFAPPDRGFPDDGVVARGPYCVPGWTFAALDLAAIARVRTAGAVVNHADWDRAAHLSGRVTVVPLRR